MKILLITLSNIGDAVMTTPVLEALHARHGNAVIDIVTDSRAAALFEHCPYRGDILLKEKKPRLRKALSLVRQLRNSRYDLVVDLRTDGLSLLLKSDRRLTRKKRNRAARHAVEQHFDTVREALGLDSIPATRLWTGNAERSSASALLAGLPGDKWLAVAPGARGPAKRWPAERFTETVMAVAGQVDAVILLGDDNDTEACRRIKEKLGVPASNLCGKTTLPGTVAVLERASAFLGNDSGAGHMAAACDVATLTVFGPGNPERYHPWHPRALWVQAESGRIDDIDVNTVARSVRTILVNRR